MRAQMPEWYFWNASKSCLLIASWLSSKLLCRQLFENVCTEVSLNSIDLRRVSFKRMCQKLSSGEMGWQFHLHLCWPMPFRPFLLRVSVKMHWILPFWLLCWWHHEKMRALDLLQWHCWWKAHVWRSDSKKMRFSLSYQLLCRHKKWQETLCNKMRWQSVCRWPHKDVCLQMSFSQQNLR